METFVEFPIVFLILELVRKHYKIKIPVVLMRGVLMKKGQVWVETVIYTLVAFSLIALVLGSARPRIQESQDKIVLEQTIDAMREIDSVVNEIKSVSGNKRVIEMGIKKGLLRIDAVQDKLVFEFEGGYTYSEPGSQIQEGNLIITSDEVGKISFVNITREYPSFNLTYQDSETSKILSEATNPYKITISNEGKDSQDKTIINFEVD